MDRRTTGIAAALVVVLAFVVAGALALGGGGDEPRDVASETGTEAAGETSTGETVPEPAPQRERGRTGFRVLASGADPAVGRRVAKEPAYADL